MDNIQEDKDKKVRIVTKKKVIDIYTDEVLSGFVRNEMWNREMILIDITYNETKKVFNIPEKSPYRNIHYFLLRRFGS